MCVSIIIFLLTLNTKDDRTKLFKLRIIMNNIYFDYYW